MPSLNVRKRVPTGCVATGSRRLAQRINLSCLTAETKVPSLNRVLITHSLMLRSLRRGGARVPCCQQRSERSKMEL
jgi:hypothetical protein